MKEPTIETAIALAQGLPARKHTLELSGGVATPIAAIRVYRPVLASIATATKP